MMCQEVNEPGVSRAGAPAKPYLAYLLRLWQVNMEEGSVWRASLESADGTERQAFGDLACLFAFLAARTRQEEGMGR
ncbi:MAG: hypothetical protein JXA93_10390 [Anaerolineae bacterium]|nr:hypothetical protein [Anaerolineae bacterium]